MVPQTSRYLGELRCTAVHGPSGVELITDAPTDNQGRGESFSPTDLVVTALMTCKITTMALFARGDGVDLEGTRAYAEKHMSTDPPRRIARISAHLEFPAGIPHEYRQKLEYVARTCPVARSLNPEIALEIGFSYPD